MVDGNYIVSLLGCANLIELVSAFSIFTSINSLSFYKQTLLIGGFIAVCLTPTDNVQFPDSSSNSIKYNQIQTVSRC